MKSVSFTSHRPGFAALFLVVVLGGVALMIVVGVTVVGFGNIERAFLHVRADGASTIADGCIEEALLRLRLDQQYRGGVLNLNGGSCILSVVPDGDEYLIRTTSTLDIAQSTRTARVEVDQDSIILKQWSSE